MVQLQKINFSYAKGLPVLEDICMDMAPGHIYGLLGKNGAGKTTLLNIVAGLLFPKVGAAMVFGEDAARRSATALGGLFYLQDRMYAPHLTVRDYGRAYSRFYPRFSHAQFGRFLQEFEVDGLRGYMDKFSLGQKKKALIAFALAANTPLLLMDEPTNDLDIPSKSIFRRIMASVADAERLIVISTHQVRDLHSLIDMVAILDGSRICLNASVDDIVEKMSFGPAVTEAGDPSVLYRESTPVGAMEVRVNQDRRVTNLDLELLFNAMMANKPGISALFNPLNR